MKELAIYIHIPFCKAKCYYCDFVSFAGKENWIDKYIDYLIKELDIYKTQVKDYSIKSIFIGGGTPSHIDAKHIERLLNFIKANFNTENMDEVTIETNPGTLDLEKVTSYKESGINRVSMGVQTLNDHHLKNIGRIHREEKVYESLDLLRKVGFKDINLDFIFGLPDETIKDVEENLNKIQILKPTHISYYGLILEKGTKLYNLEKSGKLNLPSDIKEREMYYLIKRRLKSMGYEHYEISNFACENYECKHNLLYWKIEEYIGLGLASHSFLNGRRYWNVDNFDDYFSALKNYHLPIENFELINLHTEASEFAIMGLRLIEGIDKELFKIRFKGDIGDYFEKEIEKHLKNGLLEENEKFLKLTSKGLDLSNQVEVDFLLD